jgi:hypothetical protein
MQLTVSGLLNQFQPIMQIMQGVLFVLIAPPIWAWNHCSTN